MNTNPKPLRPPKRSVTIFTGTQGAPADEENLQGQSTTAYSGGGGGGGMDIPWKDYVDAQDEKTRALNDARFAELGARLDTLAGKIDVLGDRISHIKDPLGVWQTLGIAASAVIAVVTIFGIMADRFDGGIAASGLLDQMRTEQAVRDSAQDEQFREILDRLDSLAAE